MAKKKKSLKSKKSEEIKETKDLNKMPVGVQIISVYYYLLAAFYVIIGLFVILGANAIATLLVEASPDLAAVLTGSLMTILGVVLIGFAVLCFFIGRGLWKLKAWAKIVTIILALIGIIGIVYTIISGFGWFQIIRLAINGAIAWYLLFCKEAKGVFK